MTSRPRLHIEAKTDNEGVVAWEAAGAAVWVTAKVTDGTADSLGREVRVLLSENAITSIERVHQRAKAKVNR